MNYKNFLDQLDKRLSLYSELHNKFIKCKKGCSICCEKGDYPLSQLELEYLMQGFIALNNEEKNIVKNNINQMKKGGKCPFLVNNECSVYTYRPIICRVYGIAYLCAKNIVKTPYCVNEGLNYSEVYKDGEIIINPIKENLDTPTLLKEFEFGEIRNLFDWLKND